MNILITLPKDLIGKIISGDKVYEMRKCQPMYMVVGVDGFFVVEKGTDEVRCWCRVDRVIFKFMDNINAVKYAPELCVSEDYVMRYAKRNYVYLWKIGKVIKHEGLKRFHLCVEKNPQSFAYCPLSYGESY